MTNFTVANEVKRLARMVKVSTLVALRRLFDSTMFSKLAVKGEETI